MGKADKKLSEMVNATYEERNNIVDDRVEYIKSPHRVHTDKVYDTALVMHAQLTEYSQRGGYSLCEYLDMPNLVNYVLWLHGTTLK